MSNGWRLNDVLAGYQCVHSISPWASPNLVKKLHSHRPEKIAVCSVVKAEMYFGAMKSHDPAKTLQQQDIFLQKFESLPFDDQAARYFGKIRADLSHQGIPIGPYDLQIAAIALANGCTLVTHNISEFSRVKELVPEDWEGE